MNDVHDPLDHEDLTAAQREFIKKCTSSFAHDIKGDGGFEVHEIVVYDSGDITVYLNPVYVELNSLKIKTAFVTVKSVEWFHDGPTIEITRYGKNYTFHIGDRGV